MRSLRSEIGTLTPGGKRGGGLSGCTAGAAVAVAAAGVDEAAPLLEDAGGAASFAALVYEGGGFGAFPLTQSGSGAALELVAPVALMAGFFLRAMPCCEVRDEDAGSSR